MADQTVPFSDSDTFDLLLEGVLQGAPPCVEIETAVPFDPSQPPAFSARLNEWIDLWSRANPRVGLVFAGLVASSHLAILGPLILEAARRIWPARLHRRRTRRRMELLRGYRLEIRPNEGRAVLRLVR